MANEFRSNQSVVEAILNHTFSEILSEEQAVALTWLLRHYAIYLDPESPEVTNANIEHENEDDIKIELPSSKVYQLIIKMTAANQHTSNIHTWRRRSLELETTPELDRDFAELTAQLVERIEKHPWVDRFDW